MRKYQRGATMWSTLTIVLMIGFIAMLAFKIGDIYIDYNFIKGSMQQVVDRSDFKSMSKKAILASINKRLSIDNIRGLDKDVITIKQDKTGKYLHVKYTGKAHIAHNVSALVEFDEEIRATR
jgi:hypothetical protein